RANGRSYEDDDCSADDDLLLDLPRDRRRREAHIDREDGGQDRLQHLDGMSFVQDLGLVVGTHPVECFSLVLLMGFNLSCEFTHAVAPPSGYIEILPALQPNPLVRCGEGGALLLEDRAELRSACCSWHRNEKM